MLECFLLCISCVLGVCRTFLDENHFFEPVNLDSRDDAVHALPLPSSKFGHSCSKHDLIYDRSMA